MDAIEQRPVEGTYGYDLYLPFQVSHHLGNPGHDRIQPYLEANIAAFLGAAWELCRRGFLRPSVREYGGQGNSDNLGYSITPAGEEWIKLSERDPFIAVEPSQIATMLGALHSRFGNGFQERAQEAIRCYLGNAHLACCVMCGAAVESILLAVASATRPKENVVSEYLTKGGSGRIQKYVFAKASAPIREQASAGLSLLKYWRDNAAHGEFVGLSEAQSFTSTLLLVRFASLVNDNWNLLTSVADT